MKHKILAAFLTVIMVIGLILSPVTAAEIQLPATINPPEHFAASLYTGDFFYFTASAPDDLRTLVDSNASIPTKHLQIDYKLDNGDWHYASNWDTNYKNYISMNYIADKWYQSGERESLSTMFPDSKADFQEIASQGAKAYDHFKTHSIAFRARFILKQGGGKSNIYSGWSDTYVFSHNVKSDPEKLINHAPALVSAEVLKNSGGSPYIVVKTGRLPGETQDLYAMTSKSVKTEVWLRKDGDKDFKLIHDSLFSDEYIQFDVNDYFDKTMKDYGAASYEVKIRYKLDLRAYKQSGVTAYTLIYSPFSNVFSQNMPSWSEASEWATGELKKADEYGLIPPILKGTDLTKPITREEFAELAVRLYEKITGKVATAASSNPFTDTQNPETLKAYKLGIIKGTSETTFTPKELTNREQVATMLSRMVGAIFPDGDFSTVGAPEFSDQSEISDWALEHVLFMTKMGIIKGTDGKFMPRATTTAQQAAGYATATREQAIAMGVRIFEKYRP